MEDVRNQFKGLLKKFNNPFSSSSPFTGEGHRLGSDVNNDRTPQNHRAADIHSAPPRGSQSDDRRRLQLQERWARERGPDQPGSVNSRSDAVTSDSEPTSSARPLDPAESRSPIHNGNSLNGSDAGKVRISEAFQAQSRTSDASSSRNLPTSVERTPLSAGPPNVNSDGFDPFSSYVGSKTSGGRGGSLQMFQCPICEKWWRTENDVHDHVEECLKKDSSSSGEAALVIKSNDSENIKNALNVFLSGGPSNHTLDVIMRLLRNIANNPDSEKFRKIRLSNPKIHETIGMALGGVELLRCLGFEYQTEEDEVWAVLNTPSTDQLEAIKYVISELESNVLGSSKEDENIQGMQTVQRKVDRQVRVFYAAPENLAAQMDLPDSFYDLSAAELRQEAATRRKKLEDSQIVVSRVSKEKANKRKYKAAIIRIQFPDGVILQGMFLPWEPTSVLYEFVSSTLRNPATEFDLVAPMLNKSQIIPSSAEGLKNIPTLEEANLVPATLMKFHCAESDLTTFTGLHPDFLSLMEPLSSTTMRYQ